MLYDFVINTRYYILNKFKFCCYCHKQFKTKTKRGFIGLECECMKIWRNTWNSTKLAHFWRVCCQICQCIGETVSPWRYPLLFHNIYADFYCTIYKAFDPLPNSYYYYFIQKDLFLFIENKMSSFIVNFRVGDYSS